MILHHIFLILILIALNSFFVGVEYAVAAHFRIQLDVISSMETKSALLTRSWLVEPKRRKQLINTSQLGITLCTLSLGIAGLHLFEALLNPIIPLISLPTGVAFLQPALPSLPLICALLITATLYTVLGDQVPKVIVLGSLERFVLVAVPIMQVICSLLQGLTNLLNWFTQLIIKAFGIESVENSPSIYSLAEIKQMVSGSELEGMIEEPEREMLTAVIDFGELLVRQLATPRTEVIAVEANTPISDTLRLALDKGVTKVPVYEGELDKIIGIAHLRDMVLKLQSGNANSQNAGKLAREALFVPETISVNDLLRQFRDERKHIAIVLDEFGGTAGLVTLEDLLEEIIGDVQNPFEAGPPPIQTLTDGSALIDGKTLIEEVNEYFNLELIDPDYDTMAGYILGKLGHIPKEGEVAYDWNQGVHLTVEKMDRFRIAQISLKQF